MSAAPLIVMIATDGSASAAAALRWAARCLEGTTATVHVVSVVPLTALLLPLTPGVYVPDSVIEETHEAGLAHARRALDDARTLLGPLGAHATYLAREGEPISTLLDYARGVAADLVVVGSGGKGPASRLVLGSVSDALVHRLPGAVVVVRAPAPSSAAAPAAEGAREAT